MRKIILFIAVSLDGYIAGINDDISWLFTDGDYGYKDFYSGIDTIITGRKTFELAVKLGDTFEGKPVFVFSKTPQTNYNNVSYINSDIPEFIKKLKIKKGKDIWLLGGSEIVSLLENENLIDEYVISIHPVILGDGISLFNNIKVRKKLKLINSVKYESGLVQLKYFHETNN